MSLRRRKAPRPSANSVNACSSASMQSFISRISAISAFERISVIVAQPGYRTHASIVECRPGRHIGSVEPGPYDGCRRKFARLAADFTLVDPLHSPILENRLAVYPRL